MNREDNLHSILFDLVDKLNNAKVDSNHIEYYDFDYDDYLTCMSTEESDYIDFMKNRKYEYYLDIEDDEIEDAKYALD